MQNFFFSTTASEEADSPADDTLSPGTSRLDAATTFAPRPDALEQTRTHVDELLEAVTNHDNPGWEHDEARWRLEELAEELTRDQPSAPRVKARWLRLVPVLQEVLPDLPITEMTQLINHAVGGRQPAN
ncbi:hypothetical protein [Saccharopolyspora rectivirgula]|uniref:hypothetical protein n=1 Tax=Saccharopolyspora rectivirgula TaxID=28042 RepID=UPI00240A7BC5|nr:hypothetical protein [Saccharopolyspora rectivirgula]